MARQLVSLGAFKRGISPAVAREFWELFPSIGRHWVSNRAVLIREMIE